LAFYIIVSMMHGHTNVKNKATCTLSEMLLCVTEYGAVFLHCVGK